MTMRLDTRKTKLLAHLYAKLLETHGTAPEWIEELDAIKDVLSYNRGGMKEWTFNEDGVLIFK